MKAVVVNEKGSGEVQVIEKEIPKVGAGEALVEVEYCGVCHTDLHVANGDFGKVYRAKGIIKIDGYWGKFNLVYKNFEMEAIEKAEVTKIVVIGNNLDIENLKNI